MPDCFGVPVVTCLRAFYICTQGCGCDKHPAFPAPPFPEGPRSMHHPGMQAAGTRSRVRPPLPALSRPFGSVEPAATQEFARPARIDGCGSRAVAAVVF